MDKQLYDELLYYLTTLQFLDGITDQRKTHVRKISTQYIVQNNMLFKNTKAGLRRVILENEVELIIYNLHRDMSGAHLGIDAVVGKIKDRYFWPQLGDDVKDYIRNCDVCQRRGPVWA